MSLYSVPQQLLEYRLPIHATTSFSTSEFRSAGRSSTLVKYLMWLGLQHLLQVQHVITTISFDLSLFDRNNAIFKNIEGINSHLHQGKIQAAFIGLYQSKMQIFQLLYSHWQYPSLLISYHCPFSVLKITKMEFQA